MKSDKVSEAVVRAAAKPKPVPEPFLCEANSFVFPNGERDYGDERVVKLAHELWQQSKSAEGFGG